MQSNFSRKVSPFERIFLLLAMMDCPFSNQLVLEGTGTLDASRWENAVQAASEANPGSRLLYKGRSSWAQWVDCGVTPPVRNIDGAHWSADGPEGAPFLSDPMPFRDGHSCEVVLVSGDPVRVVFRTLHATMDGGGTLVWVDDIFRALRGEPLIGSASTITDVELLSRTAYPAKREQRPRNCLAPTGCIDGEDAGFVWKRVRLAGSFSKLLPQTAVSIARQAGKQGPGEVCFNVPFDLRRRIPNIRSTANLTRRLVLNVPPDATIENVQQQMRDKLARPNGDSNLLKLFCYTPLGWIKHLFNAIRRKNLRSGRFHSTGSISNLGQLPIESFRGGGFEAQTGFFIPPGTEAKPFFMTLAGCGNGVEMVVSMPKVLANNGRLERFISRIASDLKPR